MLENKQIHHYIEYFLKKIDKKYNKSIILYFDKKCNRPNADYNVEKNIHVITYGDRLLEQSKQLGKLWRDNIRYIFSHEYGHAFHNLPYESFNEKVENEYCAERFALNYLKENYPKTYVWASKEGYSLVHDAKWGTCKSENHYRKAWERIPEYMG